MKAAATLLVLLVCAGALGACGSQGVQVADNSPYHRGAVLFRDHCSGCHTLKLVGAQGSATSIANRVRTNGPNFNIRKENVEQVLYAIRNGGFSGAIMPENIVVGKEAQEVAAFLAKYSGLEKQAVPATNISQSETPSGESGKGGKPGEAGKEEQGGKSATGTSGAGPGTGNGGTGAPKPANGTGGAANKAASRSGAAKPAKKKTTTGK
jgi:mono/diheme cytochrome c family protein